AEDIIKTQPAQPININQQVKDDSKIIVPPTPVKETVKQQDTDNEVSFDLKKIEKKPEPINDFSITDTSANADHHEEFIIETIEEEEPLADDDLAKKIVEDFGLFDPTLELSKYQFPTSELLFEHTTGGITINQAELEENKNRILETLNNYKIGIAQIKATVGPTVTLYEIVPDAGIRISKIKSLEDDIALSLSALGIRIIAPIPGKGTIGIEVPNTKPSTVSMKSLILSPKFQN